MQTLTGRHVAIGRLKEPTNLGPTSQEVKFIILILTSTKEVGKYDS